MRRTIALILLLLPLLLAAQEVWREGTEWIICYEDGSMATYKLNGKATIEGTEYLKLFVEEESNNILLAYVRSERGDTVVHIRAIFDDKVFEDELLYDFGTFEPGTTIRYGTMGRPVKELMITEETLIYYHDVIEAGDIVPCFRGILFKVGYFGNPIHLYQHPFHPKTKNISHIVLKLNEWNSQLTAPSTNAVNTVPIHNPSSKRFDIQGIPVTIRQQGIYIKKGKKYIQKK